MSDTPTDILMQEHRVIEKVLAAMTRLADRVEAGAAVEPGELAMLVPFMREFADACHHGKEEHRLFPALVAGGLPASNGPVQVMCAEHEIGRGLVGRLDGAVAAYAAGRTDAGLPAALRAIVDFYRQHIWKEDNVLFPMAQRVLGPDEAAALLAAFAEVNDGSSSRQRFIDYADRLQ
jgi:hemerythrin-like domain-containing protein